MTGAGLLATSDQPIPLRNAGGSVSVVRNINIAISLTIVLAPYRRVKLDMRRLAILLIVSTALILGIAVATPSRSTMVVAAAMLQATPTPPADSLCTVDPANATAWVGGVTVHPNEADAAVVIPVDSPDHKLYLTTWTLEKGTCVPFQADGNQKDGAIILIVQKGAIELRVLPYEEGTAAEVYWGKDAAYSGTRVDWWEEGQAPLTLSQGDWVTISDRVWLTFKSDDVEGAVVTKAVWMVPPGGSGCAGSCK